MRIRGHGSERREGEILGGESRRREGGAGAETAVFAAEIGGEAGMEDLTTHCSHSWD